MSGLVSLEWGSRLASKALPEGAGAEAAVILWAPLARAEPSRAQESWNTVAFHFTLIWLDVVDDSLWDCNFLESLILIYLKAPVCGVSPLWHPNVSLCCSYFPCHPASWHPLIPSQSFQSRVSGLRLPISYMQYSPTLGNKPDGTAAITSSLHFTGSRNGQVI